MDYDAIVVGAGPAGLTAASLLAKGKARVLVLDRESFGGRVSNLEWVEDYPHADQRTRGTEVAASLAEAAEGCGVRLELGEVTEIDAYSGCTSVTCADGKAYTASVLVLAAGLRAKKLGVPGEDLFAGKGVIHCAFCDAGLYAGRVVAVCGGGDAGILEAMTLARQAAKVLLIEAEPRLSAAPELQQRASHESRIELRCGQKVIAISGANTVEAIRILHQDGRIETVAVEGVLAQVGFEAVMNDVSGAPPLDGEGLLIVDHALATGIEGVVAAGDARCGSRRRVASAVADGEQAAASALRLLQRQS